MNPRPARALQFLAGLLAWAVVAAPALAKDRVSYALDARLSPAGDRVDGDLDVLFTNGAGAPVDRLVLLLYGRRFIRPDPGLSDITWDRVYPKGFDRGDLELLDAWSGGEMLPPAVPVPGSMLQAGAMEEGTVVVQPLAAPLAPGETVRLALRFRVVVPRRFGTFGTFRDQTTLTGGWYPYVADRHPDGTWAVDAPAPVARWRATILPPPGWRSVLNGAVHEPGTPVRHEGESRHLSLVTGRRLQATERRTPSGSYVYCSAGAPPSRPEWRDLDATLGATLGHLDGAGAPRSPAPPVLVEVPLRVRLVELAEGMVLVTDRLYHTVPLPERWEDGYVARAVMAERLRPFTARLERETDAPDVADGIAWWLLPGYLKRRFPKRLTVVDILQPFGAIPDIDRMLQTPAFPFYDEYFGNPYAFDPLRDDVSRWHRADMGPRVLFGKLAARTGAASMGGAVGAYVRSLGEPFPGLPWLVLLRQRTGVDAAGLWSAYARAHPGLDFSVQLRRLPGRDARGRREVEVTARRDQIWGNPDAPEWVGVRVDFMGRSPGRGRSYRLSWDSAGDGTERAVRLPSDGPVAFVKVDAVESLLEVDAEGRPLKSNNRFPTGLRASLLAGVLSLDLATGDIDAYAGVAVRRDRDSRHQFYAQLFHDPSSLVGLGIGYSFFFGEQVDGVFRRNRLGISVDAALLDPAYAVVHSTPISVGAALSYRFDSRRVTLFPTRGFRARASVFGGYEVSRGGPALGEYGDYIGVDLEAQALAPLSRDHVIGIQVKAGLMTATLQHRLFSLGGASDLRGLPAGSSLGPGKIFMGAEWRHVFERDWDIPLPLARLRGVQGALFVETGWVGTDPRYLEEWRVGFGYGLRFYLDLLGVLPGVTGFDVAFSPDAPVGNLLPLPMQVYFVGGQSF